MAQGQRAYLRSPYSPADNNSRCGHLLPLPSLSLVRRGSRVPPISVSKSASLKGEVHGAQNITPASTARTEKFRSASGCGTPAAWRCSPRCAVSVAGKLRSPLLNELLALTPHSDAPVLNCSVEGIRAVLTYDR